MNTESTGGWRCRTLEGQKLGSRENNSCFIAIASEMIKQLLTWTRTSAKDSKSQNCQSLDHVPVHWLEGLRVENLSPFLPYQGVDSVIIFLLSLMRQRTFSKGNKGCY